MIEFKQVNLKINRKDILSDVSVVLPETQKSVIIGKSGCGKTMLMKTLEGLYKPTSGEVLIDGLAISPVGYGKRNPVFNKIGMLFQNAALLDSFTVYQNVSLPLFERGKLPASEIRTIVEEVLDFVGLKDIAGVFPSELSGGMRKRIGLARALVTNPKYLILDEPTTGLDPITATEVLSFLKFVIQQKHIIPVTITHDPFCIKELGEFIVIMDNGRILFSGSSDALEGTATKSIKDFYNSFFL